MDGHFSQDALQISAIQPIAFQIISMPEHWQDHTIHEDQVCYCIHIGVT